MTAKEFKATTGISNWESSQNVITQAITTNSATTIDTVALNSFYSIRYDISIVQGSKIRTSRVSVQTDGTSVDSTEYGIVATGGAISGVVITAIASGSNMLLQVTITDAATTIARVRAIKNLLGVIQPYAPSAPIIGTATAGELLATVAFTAPIDNGLSAITSYSVTSTPENIIASGASSPITVTGLTQGTSYTFKARATNAYGTSVESSASNAIVPLGPPAKAGFAPLASGTTGNKLTFSNETMTTISNMTSTSGRSASAGFANSGTAGYMAGGGNSSTPSSLIDKYLFISDSASALSATLTAGNTESEGVANSGTAGYTLGGQESSGVTAVNRVNKLLFSNDTVSNISGGLTTAVRSGGSFANSGIAGYVLHGINSIGSTSTNIQKILFSNDTRSNTGVNLNTVRMYIPSYANSGVAGYAVGGNFSTSYSSASNVINKFTFSNDTNATLGITLSIAKGFGIGYANSGVAGYSVGGYNTTGGTILSIDKILFSNDTLSTISATLTSGIQYLGQGFANSSNL